MFEVQGAHEQPRTDHLRCPKSDSLPQPLLEEYNSMMKSPGHHHLTFKNRFDDGDLYFIDDGKNQISSIMVKSGSDPLAVDNVVQVNGPHFGLSRLEVYDSGKRTKSYFQTIEPATGLVTDRVTSISGQDRIKEEKGTVFESGTNKFVGSYYAAFDENGKLLQFKSGEPLADSTCTD